MVKKQASPAAGPDSTPFEQLWARPLLNYLISVSGSRTAERAAGYAKRRSIAWAKVDSGFDAIEASIRGSDFQPYDTSLLTNGSKVYGQCSCPVGYNCKHATALALLVGFAAHRKGLPEFEAGLFPRSWSGPKGGFENGVIQGIDGLFSPSGVLVRKPARRSAAGTEAPPPAPAPAPAPPPAPAEPWWRRLLQTEDPAEQKALLKKAASARMAGNFWGPDNVTKSLLNLGNPVQMLREFDEAVEREYIYSRFAPAPRDEELQAFLDSDEARELWEQQERRAAEKRLLEWLEKPAEGEGTLVSAASDQLQVTWDTRPIASLSGIETVVFHVRVQKRNGGLTLRTMQSLFQLTSAVDREERSFGPLKDRFLRWLIRRPELQDLRYNSFGYAPEEARTTLPIPDLFAWISAWGDSDLLTWEKDGSAVRLVPQQAHLTLLPGESGRLRWVVQVPAFGDEPAGTVALSEAHILIESEKHGDPRPHSRIFLSQGSRIRPLATSGMPLDVLAAARLLPEPPMEKVRGTKAGVHLARRLTAARPSSAPNPYLQEVSVTPVVELRLNEGWLTVRAYARAENGALFARLQRGVWEPVPARALREGTGDSAEMATPADPAPEPESEHAVHTGDDAGSAAEVEAAAGAPGTAEGDGPLPDTILATLPRADDVKDADEWVDALPPAGTTPSLVRHALPERAWPLTSSGLAHLLEAWITRPRGVEYLGDREFRELIEIRKVPKYNLQIDTSGIDWLSVSVEVENELEALSLAEVIAALESSTSDLILLKGGRVFRRAELEEWQKEVEGLATLGLSTKGGRQRLHALHLAGASTGTLENLERASEGLRRLAESARTVLEQFQGIPEAPVEPATAAFLRPYQRTGADFLVWAGQTFGGAILADDMGLGKTLQVLAALTALREHRRHHSGAPAVMQAEMEAAPPARRSRKSASKETRGTAALPEPAGGMPALPPALVVCPASVAHNWQREAQRFAPGLRVLVLESGSERQEYLKRLHEYDLVIVNYALLRRDAEALGAISWLAIVADEAQAIKNPKAEVTRVIQTLDASCRFALTGTPIENRILDLWSIVDFALPGYLNQLDPTTAASSDPVVAARFYQMLRARLRPVLLRRLKAEVAPELPERIESRLDCEMNPKQRKLYLAELKRARGMLAGSGPKIKGTARIQILAALTRLRQICCDPMLVGHGEIPSAKVESLLELVHPILEEGHKILVFSQFVKMLQQLRTVLQQEKISTHILTGQTTSRPRVITAFEQDPEPCVFLISLKAGGTGLNLTSASHVLLFDPWWNPAVEAQAIDRAHRIGQDKTVLAYRLVTKQTIEERILELQQRKLALVQNVLEEEAFNRTLSRDDFEFLLTETGE